MDFKILVFCKDNNIYDYIVTKAKKDQHNYTLLRYCESVDFYNTDAFIIDCDDQINIKILKHIKDKKMDKPIILIGSNERQAIEGYYYNAFRFVKKNDISHELDLIFNALENEYNSLDNHIYLTDKSKAIVCVNHKNIMYFYSSGNYTVFKDLEGNVFRKRIAPKMFLREIKMDYLSPYAGFYVNPKYIKRVDILKREMRLKDNTKISISKRRVNIVLKSLIK